MTTNDSDDDFSPVDIGNLIPEAFEAYPTSFSIFRFFGIFNEASFPLLYDSVLETISVSNEGEKPGNVEDIEDNNKQRNVVSEWSSVIAHPINIFDQ